MARACSEQRKAMAVGDVGGLRQPIERMHAHDLLHVALAGLHLGAQRRRHHVGRADAVDADAVPAELDGEQLGQRSMAALPML